MNLFELFVKIGVDDQASKNISNIAGKLGKGLKTAAKVGTAAVATVTAAAGAMTAAFVKGTSEVAQYGDNIDKMSQKMGLSAEAYQEWDFIMQHSGTSMETLKASMKTLANAVDTGNKSFKRLGISQKELSEMSQEEIFERTIAELQKVEDTTERTYLAGQLLGRGATELGALLNTSAEDTEAMRQQVHELGGVMSNEAVKAAAAYQDSLQNMQTAFSGIQRGMLSEVLPSMVTVMDGLALIFSGNDSGLAKITEGVNQFTDKLMEAVPKIFELGEGILSSLSTAILDNLPTLTTTATKVMLQLFEGIVSALPSLFNVVTGTIIPNLLSAITTVFSSVVDVLPSLIESLVGSLSTLLPSIIETAVSLVVTLASQLPNIIKPLLVGLPDVIKSVLLAISDSLPILVETIMTLVTEIVKLLPEYLNVFLTVIPELYGSLYPALIDSLPILLEGIGKLAVELFKQLPTILIGLLIGSSPFSLLFLAIYGILKHYIGEDLGEKILEFLGEAWENVTTFFSGVFDFVKDFVSKLIQAYVDAFVKMINFYKELPGKIWKFLLDIISFVIEFRQKIIKAVLEIIKNIVSTAIENVKKFKEIGKNIVSGIKEGIKSAWENLKSWFKNLFGDLIGIAKKILGIASPSKVFKKIGGFTAEGFGVGFEDEFAKVKDDMEDALNFDDASVGINASIRKVGAGAAGGAFGGTSIGNININIDGAKYSDEQSLASAIALEIQNMTDRRAAVYA